MGLKMAVYPIGCAEMCFYFFVWLSHSLLAFSLAIRASWNVGHWLDHWLEPSSYSDAFRMDNSDVELKLFRLSLPNVLGAFAVNSVLFRLILRLNLSKNGRSLLLVSLWFVLNAFLASVRCVLLVVFATAGLLSVTLLFNCQFFAWAFAILAIGKVSVWAPFSTDPVKYYREFNLYLYSAIKAINLSIFLVRKRSKVRLDCELAREFLEYLLYPPYATALIVLFEDFRCQFRRVSDQTVPLNMSSSLWKAFRLLFWFFVLEFLLHLCKVNAFFNSPFTLLGHLNLYEVASIAYVAGQLFHLKYFLIFGVPSLFASIDGFQPPVPPICIARVAKYSQMWRFFDRGLYTFLKEQLYIPLIGLCALSAPNCLPKLLSAFLRHIVPTVVVFAFVLLWHGLSSNYFCWVSLSATALITERIGQSLPNWSRICPNCSEATFVRLKAIGMLFTVIPGTFGIFFFLGLNGIGAFIFRSLLLDGLWHIFSLQLRLFSPNSAGFVLLHLFLLGFCFNNVCLYLDAKLAPQRRQLAKAADKGTKCGERSD